MASVTTLDPIYWPLMDVPTVKLNRCLVCGRVHPLNEHHIVWRSWGQLIGDNGKPRRKPTVTLCGLGSNLYGTAPDGTRVMYCHGRAHQRMLHFRNDRGCLEVIELDEPTGYLEALEMDGWRAV